MFGIDIPDLFTSRAWGVHTEWADKNPKLFAMLERTSREAHASEVFREGYRKTGADGRNLVYGDRKACTEFALKTIELAKRYEKVLTAKRGKGRLSLVAAAALPRFRARSTAVAGCMPTRQPIQSPPRRRTQ